MAKVKSNESDQNQVDCDRRLVFPVWSFAFFHFLSPEPLFSIPIEPALHFLTAEPLNRERLKILWGHFRPRTPVNQIKDGFIMEPAVGR